MLRPKSCQTNIVTHKKYIRRRSASNCQVGNIIGGNRRIRNSRLDEFAATNTKKKMMCDDGPSQVLRSSVLSIVMNGAMNALMLCPIDKRAKKKKNKTRITNQTCIVAKEQQQRLRHLRERPRTGAWHREQAHSTFCRWKFSSSSLSVVFVFVFFFLFQRLFAFKFAAVPK